MSNRSTIPSSPLLRLDGVNLTTALGSNYLLENLSFTVAAGERVAVVGPSGAGKTTLLRLLNRLISPTSGSIYLENRNYEQIPALELRRQVVLVLQESKLLGMSVAEAIAYPLRLRGLQSPEIEHRLSDWMEQLHIPKEWRERTELQLSVGQRQLVAIARACAIQPHILLLDEPTSALDAGKAAQVLQGFGRLANQQTTILMVNHQLDLAQQFCTRVLHLQGGRLIQDKPSHQIDWLGLRENLIQAEAQQAEEWNE